MNFLVKGNMTWFSTEISKRVRKKAFTFYWRHLIPFLTTKLKWCCVIIFWLTVINYYFLELHIKAYSKYYGFYWSVIFEKLTCFCCWWTCKLKTFFLTKLCRNKHTMLSFTSQKCRLHFATFQFLPYLLQRFPFRFRYEVIDEEVAEEGAHREKRERRVHPAVELKELRGDALQESVKYGECTHPFALDARRKQFAQHKGPGSPRTPPPRAAFPPKVPIWSWKESADCGQNDRAQRRWIFDSSFVADSYK